MKDVRKIKKNHSEISALRQKAEQIKAEISGKQREFNSITKNIKELEQDIRKIERNGRIKVSEHAVLRYFERVANMNIADVEQLILAPEVLDLVSKLGGSGTYPHPAGFSIVMKDNTITTII